MSFTSELIIIGAGASGLMAAVTAGECGLSCLLLERRHRPGLKLLMCGNNRCNISHAGDDADLLKAYGEPVDSFLQPAIAAFPPSRLRQWFRQAGVPTILNRDRIYPKSEKADDVLYCFTDQLRDQGIPLTLNCPVSAIERLPAPQEGFRVFCGALTFFAPRVLLATGGVSYPKTGSVGDGYRLAKALGHSIQPPRASLAGMESTAAWLPSGGENAALNTVRLTIQEPEQNNTVGMTEGNLLLEKQVLRGSAIFDASRLIARAELSAFTVSLDLLPDLSLPTLQASLSRLAGSREDLPRSLTRLGIEPAFAASIAKWLPAHHPTSDWGNALKAMPLTAAKIRPLKEAIVTRGGVTLSEINPASMESKICPGLYFAGELIDIDGPTGGFNLHAAFATARLAVEQMAGKSRHTASGQKQRRVDRRQTQRRRQSPKPTEIASDKRKPAIRRTSAKTDFWRQRQPPTKGGAGRGKAQTK